MRHPTANELRDHPELKPGDLIADDYYTEFPEEMDPGFNPGQAIQYMESQGLPWTPVRCEADATAEGGYREILEDDKLLQYAGSCYACRHRRDFSLYCKRSEQDKPIGFVCDGFYERNAATRRWRRMRRRGVIDRLKEYRKSIPSYNWATMDYAKILQEVK